MKPAAHSEPRSAAEGSRTRGAALFVAGWLVPGLGHALLRQWSRAIVFFVSIVGLAAAGLWLRGNVYDSSAADVFEWLGYIADLATGVVYPLARYLSIAPDLSRAAGDYGTRFFAAAGALNLLCAFDAYAIGTGIKK